MIVPAFWGLADKRAFMYFITNGTTKGRGMANLIKLSAMLALMVMPVMHAASADDDAPEPSAKAAEILAKYDRTGDTRTCLNINRIRQIRALDDRHFLVRANTSKYYLNITSNTCHGASRATNRLQYTTSIAQLCRNQIVRVIDNTTGIFSGSCGLGSFELLEKKVETDEDDDTQTDEGAR